MQDCTDCNAFPCFTPPPPPPPLPSTPHPSQSFIKRIENQLRNRKSTLRLVFWLFCLPQRASWRFTCDALGGTPPFPLQPVGTEITVPFAQKFPFVLFGLTQASSAITRGFFDLPMRLQVFHPGGKSLCF